MARSDDSRTPHPRVLGAVVGDTHRVVVIVIADDAYDRPKISSWQSPLSLDVVNSVGSTK